MGRKIVITSGKGGVGKTTLTANLGYRLAKSGERVVAVDGDLGLNNLDVAMGVEGKIGYDLFDCIEDKCRTKQALVESPWHKNLFIMPACFGKNRMRADLNSMKNVVDELARSFDFVLIDCPAGIDEGFKRAATCADEAVVVVTPHISSIRDADKVVNLLFEAKPLSIGLVVNRMRGDLSAEGEILNPSDISSLLKVKLLGVIPEDDAIFSGLSLGKGRSGRAFSLLASGLCSGKFRIYDCEERYTGFFGSIRRKIKKML